MQMLKTTAGIQVWFYRNSVLNAYDFLDFG